MAAPRIGVTTYGRDARGWFELPAQYVDAVRRSGGLPILLAPGEPHLEEWLAGIDGLVLSGGGDLDPATYGEQASDTCYHVDAERDAQELALARHVLAAKLPALCICRGMQVLNVALGGSLHQHLPDVFGSTVQHRAPPREPILHPVRVETPSRLATRMESSSVRTMSWHHQALKRLGSGLRVVAMAPDGVIEAVELDSHPQLVAVQWHPELTEDADPTQQRLFEGLVQDARKRKGNA